MMFDTSCQEATTENQEDVRQDGAQHTGLHDSDFSILQGDNADLSLPSAA